MLTRVIASAIVLTAVATLAAGVTASQTTQTTKLDFTGITALEARTFNGAVIVQVGTESASLKTVKLGEATVSVTRRGNRLVVEAKTTMLAMPNSRVDLEIRAPAGLSVTLETNNGKAESHGAVKSVQVKVGNGDVRVEDTSNATIYARSGNGSVIVKSSSGHLDAWSGNGRVSIESFSFAPGSRSTVRSGYGSVTVLAPRAPGGLRITGTTTTGRLNLCLPGYEVKTEKLVVGGRFTAVKAGTDVATLGLSIGHGDIVVNPSLLIGDCN